MKTPKKNLRFNADDFGKSSAINRSIIDAHDKGYVLHASLLTNGDRFEEALQLAKKRPNLHIGIHLNFSELKPLKVSSQKYCYSDGSMPGALGEWRRNGEHINYDLNIIYREFKAQITKALEAGINIKHLDSHGHIHKTGGLLAIYITLSLEFNLQIRSWGCPEFVKKLGICHSDRTIPLLSYQDKTYEIENIVKNWSVIEGETVEIMAHPFMQITPTKDGSLNLFGKEYEILTDSKLMDFLLQNNYSII